MALTNDNVAPRTSPTLPLSSWWSSFNLTDLILHTPPDDCIVVSFSKSSSPRGDTEDLVSNETVQRYRRVVNAYLLTLFFFISVPSNIVNMIVFWKHGIKERINLCLFSLSFVDLLTVVAHFTWNLDEVYSELSNNPFKMVVAKYLINHMFHILGGLAWVSGFITTLIAFERCLCVVTPLKAKQIMSTRTSAVVIAVSLVAILSGNSIVVTRWRVVCMFDPLTGQSVDQFYPSDFYQQNARLVKIFEGIIFGIILPVFFVVGVSLSTFIIIVKLQTQLKWRDQSSSAKASGGSASDVSLTRMLIGTNILFLVCTGPFLVFRCITPFVPELDLNGKHRNTFNLMIGINLLSGYINASVNFFIYYNFGSKFRETVKKLLTCA